MAHTRPAGQDMMRLAGQPQHKIPGNRAKYGQVQINKKRQGIEQQSSPQQRQDKQVRQDLMINIYQAQCEQGTGKKYHGRKLPVRLIDNAEHDGHHSSDQLDDRITRRNTSGTKSTPAGQKDKAGYRDILVEAQRGKAGSTVGTWPQQTWDISAVTIGELTVQ